MNSKGSLRALLGLLVFGAICVWTYLQTNIQKLPAPMPVASPIPPPATVAFSKERLRLDADGDIHVAFEATRQAGFKRGYVTVTARCKGNGQTKIDDSGIPLNSGRPGDTTEHEVLLNRLNLRPSRCEFGFNFRENMMFGTDIEVKSLCWQAGQMKNGKCGG